LRLEGVLFLPDQLEKATQGLARRQDQEDYGTPKGLKLKDEYSRAFQIACAQWKHFAASRNRDDLDPIDVTMRFVKELFRDALGYRDIRPVSSLSAGERHYPLTFVAGLVPIVVAPHTLDLDDLDEAFAAEGSGSRRKSAFQLAQEFLNASTEHLWALVSNGRQVRLLRDAATLSRPSYLEIDLQDLLDGQRFAEFACAWRVLHASRAGAQSDPAESCIWEIWREAGKEEGTRVREGLRKGVEQALLSLGSGFLRHPANEALRQQLQLGELSNEAYFQQLLRLIYRLIFLFTVEERGVLHLPDDSSQAIAARRAYAEGYAMARLRERALRRRARSRFDDIWKAARIVFRGLASGEPRLALPALGGLFAPDQCAALDAASLSNADLLISVRHLRWDNSSGSLAPVDYRNMGPEELGSVYESLLELVPEVELSARQFGFVGLTSEGSTQGNARKTSGSYYTPDSLVQQLIRSALDPVIEQRLTERPDNPTGALLDIKVIDPACGSGHFLLAAARRLAERLAALRSPEGAAKPQDYRHALREVIGRCIYGVDRNPMARELCRMALWLEGFEEGRPLSFLDHHLQCGDALLGITDLKALEAGISAAAFKPLSGDDKDVCRELTKANNQGLKQLERDLKRGQQLMRFDAASGLDQLKALEALPDATTGDIEARATAWAAFRQQAEASRLAHASDLHLGAFLLPKTQASVQRIPTSQSLYLELFSDQPGPLHAQQLDAARAVCREANVLHWPLAFPQVAAQGGFDCVLGNPPWERIKLQEEEFFATRYPLVAQAKNKAERSQRIDWLAQGMLARNLYAQQEQGEEICLAEQRLYREFLSARRTAEAASVFAHVKGEEAGRFPLTGVGDVNTYALFAETISQIVAPNGRAGFIVPTGIATDDSTKRFFSAIVGNNRLSSFIGFDNAKRIFPAVHPDTPFALVTLASGSSLVTLAFYLLGERALSEPERFFRLGADDFSLMNPNTLTCPVFRARRDAELARKIYRRLPVLIREARDSQPEQNPWGISFMAMFHMSNDSHLFADAGGEGDLPLYEAKMIHQFDHRWATYEPSEKGQAGKGEVGSRDVTENEKANLHFSPTPRYWVNDAEVRQRLADKDWERQWLLGWRDITNATNERTVIASVLPLAGVGNKAPLILCGKNVNPTQVAALVGNLCALVFDFTARQKIGGTTLNYYLLKQFPVLPPDAYTDADLAFIVPRVLELTYTAWDLEPWAQDLGFEGPPFRFDPDRRAVLRAELDAWYARAYGLTRDELRYILDPTDVEGPDYPSETFRVLQKNELKAHGEYRTQRLVLEAWDALELQKPITIPALKPARRTAPLPIYAEGSTPASEAEDFLAGLVCDVLLQTGPCDDTRLRLILASPLPPSTPHAEELDSWRVALNTARWPHLCNWLRSLLGVPITAPLSVRAPDLLNDVIGDARTESLAQALIEARRQRETALEATMAGSASQAQPVSRKRG
jgi:hypothetical protein